MPETTNDDLARMIKAGFDGVDTALQRMETRLTGRLDHIEQTILADYGRRIERIEDALALPRAA